MALTCVHIGSCGCLWGGKCCLACPLPECVYGMTPASALRAIRDEKIRRARATQKVKFIVGEFGISKRSVHRVLAK